MRIIREKLNQKLWQYFKGLYWQPSIFEDEANIVLDHLAIIDLPSANSGIHILERIFSKLGYEKRGEGFLKEKNNNFIWMGVKNLLQQKVDVAAPQIVLADFTANYFSQEVQSIIKNCTAHIPPFAFAELDELLALANGGSNSAAEAAVELVFNNLIARTWNTPSLAEYTVVNRENELLSWVLACGRMINHFGISIHTMPNFHSLGDFINYLTANKQLKLNNNGGVIKGSALVGIEQAATIGEDMLVELRDGHVHLSAPFIEFIWRHPLTKSPIVIGDYYSNFLPANADNIIESVYAS